MEMSHLKWAMPLAVVAAFSAGSSAFAQPQTKLTTGLSKSLIQAIWCSSVLLEESFIYDEGSEDAVHYESLAFELGDEVDVLLKDEHNLRQAEVDELWALFDDEAYWLAGDNEDRFMTELRSCETSYDSLL